MSAEQQLLVLRGSRGISFVTGPPSSEKYDKFEGDENPSCQDMTFTKNGNLLSWCSNQRTSVIETKNFKSVFEASNSHISLIDISPKGTYLSTWEPYSAKQSQQESCNLHIWHIETGKCIKSFIQKRQAFWKPQWSDDEFLCARNVNNEIHFFENSNFETIAKKVFLQKVAFFSLAPGEAPYHVACFVPGIKGQPSFVRLFQYPNFEGQNSVIAQKSFFKAERTDFYWNKTGKDCIFLASVDVDKTGASYYGEVNLYYASVRGDTARVATGKEGPVYSIQWSPYENEFCVVYGLMPAKATIYNLKCEPVFDFGCGSRNEVAYSPVGDRLSLSGFGNLQGDIEVWDLKQKKMVSKFKARDTTLMAWSYDGEYILTATTSPRLRIGNGYRIWHYTGSLLVEKLFMPNEELFDIRWKPVPEGYYKAKPTTYTPVPGIQSICPATSKAVYRPPCAQGKPASFKLHEEESPASKTDSSNAAISKNKKKNLARKAKKNENNAEVPKAVEDLKHPVSEAPAKNDAASKVELTGDPEKDKKIRSLLKKLDQIEKLKKDQAAGKQLELNQLEKIKKAIELEEELSALQLN